MTNITKDVKYQIIDTQKKVILGSFDSEDGAELFLIENPIYRRPQIKMVPTLTHRDIISLDILMKCFSDIYESDDKTWFDNKIVNKIAREFLEKIDDIRSSESVIDYL